MQAPSTPTPPEPVPPEHYQALIRAEDAHFMSAALTEARRGWYSASPNPRVGCVIVKDQQIIGRGFHPRTGSGHAEIHALADAGSAAHGATAYVTLEPCAHTGRTGPCCETLANAGIARVVYGMRDPNPLVAGRGLQFLHSAGIEVAGPVLHADCEALNTGFLKRMRQGLPWVTVKLAMSLDGKTAMASGESKWITGAEARADVQRLRAEHCAIISSASTVATDCAELTVREPSLIANMRGRALTRVILDRRGQLSPELPVFNTQAPSLWCTQTPGMAADKRQHWQIPTTSDSKQLRALLHMLASEQQANSVLVEAGATLAGQFLQAGLVDRLIVYLAPKLLGSGAQSLVNLPFNQMSEALNLDITDVRAVGRDWRLSASPRRPE